MRAITTVAAHRLRASWRAWAVLALLTGLAGGVVMTAAAGARRTENAYPQFLRSTAAADVLVAPASSGVGGFDFAIAKLPGVRQIAPVVGLNCQPLLANGKIDEAAEVAAPLDDRLGRQLQRPKMLAGRSPLPGRADEVMVDQIAAKTLGLHLGSVLRLAAENNNPKLPVRYLTVHVVGIEVISDSIVLVNKLAQTAYIQASIALYRELGAAYQAFDGDYVKLAPGTTVSAFTTEATHLARARQYQKATGGQLFVADESVQAATAERAIRPEAVALAIFALVLAVTALLMLGQAAIRVMLASSVDNPVLAALGLTRWQLLAASLLQVLVAGAASAVLACAVAIAASPLMPIGPARLAELHPGLSVDATVLAAGFVATVVLLLARVAWPAWRESSARGEASAPSAPADGSRTARWLAGSGAPVTAVTGVRMALERGRGRGAVAAHSAVIGTALAVAAFMASVTFGANLVHLERTPRLYGKTWDAAMDLQFSTIPQSTFDKYVRTVPGLTAWTFGFHGTVTLGKHGSVVPAIGLAPGRGQLLTPTMLTGRPPAAGQLVLGSSTMRSGAFRLGQIVDVTASGKPQALEVVGRAVFPYFGQGSFTPTDLGAGALVPASLLAAQADQAGGRVGYNFVLLKFAPGPRKAADIAAFDHAFASYCTSVEQSTCVVTNQQPNGLINYQPVDATPLILAGLLAVLGLGVLAQFAFQSARSRRRDFAVLRTLGLRRHQLAAVMFWQISTVTGLALLLGLPLGAAAGHWAWALFADLLGISPGTAIPIATGLLLIPAVLLAANAVALWPASGSTRTRPAQLLRTE